MGGGGEVGTQATGGWDTSGDAGVTAWLTVDPKSFDIGVIDPGDTEWADLRITNTGPARSGDIWIDLGPGLFSPYGGRISPLDAGEQGYFSFEIGSRSEGELNSYVSLTANPGANPPLQIPVKALVALTGPITVSPRQIDLGRVIYGSSNLVTFQVTAREDVADLTVELSELLTLDSRSTCSAVLAKDESCDCILSFYVGYPGPVGAEATVTATGSSTKVVKVGISGYTSTTW